MAALTLLTFCFDRYCDAETKTPVITIHAKCYTFSPSEITLKRGQEVKLVFVSDDVPHAVVVDGLGIDLNIENHRSSQVVITPTETGDFKGRCSRYCGTGHSAMAFVVHVAN